LKSAFLPGLGGFAILIECGVSSNPTQHSAGLYGIFQKKRRMMPPDFRSM
jgi:hypothetical protein